jgi:hypothetical protein
MNTDKQGWGRMTRAVAPPITSLQTLLFSLKNRERTGCTVGGSAQAIRPYPCLSVFICVKFSLTCFHASHNRQLRKSKPPRQQRLLKRLRSRLRPNEGRQQRIRQRGFVGLPKRGTVRGDEGRVRLEAQFEAVAVMHGRHRGRNCSTSAGSSRQGATQLFANPLRQASRA